MANPFQLDRSWLKGNLHTHTTNSDGPWSPQDTVDNYAAKGYDFLTITDHNMVTNVAGLRTGGLTLLPGAEVVVSPAALGQTIHVVVLGPTAIPEDYDPANPPPPQALPTFGKWCELFWIAHPFWSLLEPADILPLEGYIGVEVYNTICHYHTGRGCSEMIWDTLLLHGRKVWGLAVDDIHRENQAGKGWIMLKAEDSTPTAIYSALRQGLFYSTSGPQIYDVQIQGDEVEVHCSPCQEVAAIGLAPGTGWTTHRTDITPPYEHVHIPWDVGQISLRIECIDEAGRKAWTNPFFI